MSDALVGGLRWYHERLSVGKRPAKSREALLRLATPLGDDSDDWKRTYYMTYNVYRMWTVNSIRDYFTYICIFFLGELPEFDPSYPNLDYELPEFDRFPIALRFPNARD